MDCLKVLLVEDHKMVRLGLSLVFEHSGEIELIGEAEDGKKGVELALELKPDVVLMDIGLPEMDGIQATTIIKKTNPDIKVLIFTSRESDDDVFDSLSAGADGYIMKGATTESIHTAIRSVNDGVAWIDPQIAKLVLSSIQAPGKNKEHKTTSGGINYKVGKSMYGLTEREMEVLALIVNGMTNPQIAEELTITRATAKAHVHSVLQKLSTATRTQATRKAMDEGLV